MALIDIIAMHSQDKERGLDIRVYFQYNPFKSVILAQILISYE